MMNSNGNVSEGEKDGGGWFIAALITAAALALPALAISVLGKFTQLETQRAAQQVGLVAAQAQLIVAEGQAAIDQAAARAVDSGTMATTFDRLAAHPDLARQVSGTPWLVPFLLGIIAALAIVLILAIVWRVGNADGDSVDSCLGCPHKAPDVQ